MPPSPSRTGSGPLSPREPERSAHELERLEQQRRAALARAAALEVAGRCSTDAILITDAAGLISWVNPAAVALSGRSAAELIGTPLDPAPQTAGLSAGAQAEASAVCRMISGHRDGRAVVEEQTIALVADPTGGPHQFVVIRRDVTRLKQDEAALDLAHAELRLILDSITAILIVLDAQGRVSTWNAQAERTFGLPAERVRGRRLDEVELPLDEAPLLHALAACLAEGRDQRLDDVPFERAEGRGLLGISLSPMRSADGRVRGCLVFARDITQRKNLEVQLARAQKLESLGQLAAGIAHEINTPTQFVSDNTGFLKSSLQELRPMLEACEGLRHASPGSPEFQALVTQLLSAAERADIPFALAELPKAIDDSLDGLGRIAGIVRAMKEFSHPGGDKKQLADVNHCIESTVVVARNEWKYVAELELALDRQLPLVPCYPQDLNQVVLNMIVNAAHAIQERRAKDGSDELGKITIRTAVRAGQLELRISDTGCGIPEAIRNRVFDPFFTTKAVGKGTGQGLAIAHHVVVEKHGGHIDIESQVGAGTTFVVRLPLTEQAAELESSGLEASA